MPTQGLANNSHKRPIRKLTGNVSRWSWKKYVVDPNGKFGFYLEGLPNDQCSVEKLHK